MIKIDKKCACGVIHEYLPSDARLVYSVYWWNCSCNSTLIYIEGDAPWKRNKDSSKILEDRLSKERAANNESVKRELNLATSKPTTKQTARLSLVKEDKIFTD